jgi:DNA-binding XRE family transcriptional regulator
MDLAMESVLLGPGRRESLTSAAPTSFINNFIVPLYPCAVNGFCCKIMSMSRTTLSHLQEHRKRRGLTQEELFKLSGVSRSTIAELESGSRMAREGTIRKVARALKVKPEDLV